jgi:hypothetical protein
MNEGSNSLQTVALHCLKEIAVGPASQICGMLKNPSFGVEIAK